MGKWVTDNIYLHITSQGFYILRQMVEMEWKRIFAQVVINYTTDSQYKKVKLQMQLSLINVQWNVIILPGGGDRWMKHY